MYELLVKIRHENCPINLISDRHPNTTIVQWCNERTDIFEVKARLEEVKSVLRELKVLVHSVHGRIKHQSLDAHEGRLVILTSSLKCACHRAMKLAKTAPVTETIEQHHCLPIKPMTYQAGWEHHRLVSFDDSKLTSLFKAMDRMGTTKILLKRKVDGDMAQDIFTVSLSRLFSDLTEKQLEALVEALDNGYYKVPRTITVGKLAQFRGVPRTTFEEHLHKAESKVLLSIAPFLSLYATPPQEQIIMVSRPRYC